MNNKIVLNLGESNSNSKLNALIFEEELKEINLKHPLEENQIDIKSTYFLKNANDLEVGFFIRNGLSQNIAFEHIPLIVQDANGNIIAANELHLKVNEIIPAYSARPFDIKFQLSCEVQQNNLNELTIKFGKLESLNAFHSVFTEVKDIPIELEFEEERAMKEFARELKTIKSGEFDVTLYKLNYKNKSELDCILFFRNATNKEIKLERFPIRIINEKEELIAQKIFKDKDGLIKLSSNQSKFMTFEFSQSELLGNTADISKCRVLYK